MSFREEQKLELQRKENELLRTTFMGDIKEDVEFLGLTLTDIIWIMVNTVACGFLVAYMMPFSIWIKGIWIISVFIFNLVGRINKWPYRIRRFYRYMKLKKVGDGSMLSDFLGVDQDSWTYRNQKNKQIHIVSSLTAQPWNTALYNQKNNRIQGYEMFLRSLVLEGFTASISAEIVPDYRHEYWERKRQEPAVSEGVEKLRTDRLDLWEDLVNSEQAMRSEYTLTLSVDEKDISSIQLDEEEDMTNDERKRYRMMSELREKKDRVMGSLEGSGHTVTLLSGFSLPEIASRWMDKRAWEEWKVSGEGWMEEEQVTSESNDESTQKDDKAVSALRVLHKRFAKNLQNEVASAKEEEGQKGPSEIGGNLASIGLFAEKSSEELPIVEAQPDMELKQADDAVLAALEAIPNNGGHVPKNPLKQILGRLKLINWEELKSILLPKKSSVAKEPMEVLEDTQIDATVVADEVSKGVTWKHLWNKIQSTKLLLKPKVKAAPELPVEENHILDNVVTVRSEPEISMVEMNNRAYALTSVASTGKTFVGSNLSVSLSLSGKYCTLIDLSPDRGSLTVLNPKLSATSEGWEIWKTRHAPDLNILIPKHYPLEDEVIRCVEESLQKGIVMLDVPWNYPGRNRLEKEYGLIAVLDCDYHHWTQFERTNDNWNGELWLNQNNNLMTKSMSQLVKDRYSKSFTSIFPYYEQANKYLYQGRPMASDAEFRSIFCSQMMEVTDKQCSLTQNVS